MPSFPTPAALFAFLALSACAAGCAGSGDDDSPEPADTDTDTDADTDTDTDVDTDTGTARTPYTFEGTVTLASTLGGVVDCDATANLVGTPYTGACEGCDFALDIVAHDGVDASAETCTYYAPYSFLPGGGYTHLVMAHADVYYDYFTYRNEADVFFSGYNLGEAGPYFHGIIAYDGSTYGTFTRDGDAIDWSFTQEGVTTFRYGYDACGADVLYSYAEEGFGGEGGDGTVACDGSTTDVWTFTGTGDPVSITLDTSAPETAFDPAMWVDDADQCSLYFGDDNFECTFPPRYYSCPSIVTEATTAGAVYAIYAVSQGNCNGEVAGYTLAVAGAEPGSVTLATDDAVSGVAYSLAITGSGTLTAVGGAAGDDTGGTPP